MRLNTPMAIVGTTNGKPDIIPYKAYLRRIIYGWFYNKFLTNKRRSKYRSK